MIIKHEYILSNGVKLTSSYDDKFKLDKYNAILILPGGGYEFISLFNEGKAHASFFNSLGFVSFVLEYSIFPSTFPSQLLEVYAALRFIKKEFSIVKIDIDNVFISGSSAGGHLALNSQTILKEKDFLNEHNINADIMKVKGLILSYPVVINDERYTHGKTFKCLTYGIKDKKTLNLVNLVNNIHKDICPIFCYATYQDSLIEIENSLLLAMECKKHNVNIELHIYALEEHGLSLANKECNPNTDEKVLSLVGTWPNLVENWLKVFST